MKSTILTIQSMTDERPEVRLYVAEQIIIELAAFIESRQNFNGYVRAEISTLLGYLKGATSTGKTRNLEVDAHMALFEDQQQKNTE